MRAVDPPSHRAIWAPRNPITGIAGCCAPRRERPRSRRTAEQRDELAPLHSITSSATASSVGGTVRPSIERRLRVDDQLELARLHDRQVGRLRAL